MDEDGGIRRREPFGNPTVRDRGAATRHNIIASGLAVFAEHGFFAAKVEMITEAAGCSRAAFYQYFSSKDDVFWNLAARLATEMEQLSSGLGSLASDASGLVALREWFDGLVELEDRYAPIFASFDAAARTGPASARSSRSVNLRIGAEFVGGAADRDGIASDSVAAATAMTMVRAIGYWRVKLAPISRRRVVEGLAQTAHRLRYGPIDRINVGPPVRLPRATKPRWPEFAEGATPARPMRANGRRTRERLLDAASTLLAERGYHATRVDHMAAAAGLSHAGYYRYFENKADLFRALAGRAALEMIDLLEGWPDAEDPTELRQWLGGWFDSYRRNGGVISVWQEISHDDPELASYSAQVARVAYDRLTRIVYRRAFGDAAVDALVLLSVIERVPYCVFALDYMDESDAVEAALVLIRRGLFGLETDPAGGSG